MGYRICYGKQRGNNRIIRRIMTAVFFLVFLFLVNNFWPEGAEALQGLISRMGSTAAVTALDNMAEELMNGGAVREVFSDFLDRLTP